MKAAVFFGTKDIRIKERQQGQIADDEILIRVKACGVCGTDVHIFQGEKGSAEVEPPVVLGHEFSGEVVEVGGSCHRIRKGDRVAVDPNIYCGNCHFCQLGKVHLCENLQAIGVTRDGGFAQFAVVPEKQAYKVPSTVSFEAGALAEPIACCLHGIDLARVKPGSTVLIVGGGTIGLIMAQLARLSGASKIFLSEPLLEKRELAERLGVDETIDPNEQNVAEYISKATKFGVDLAIECVGKEETINSAIDSCARGGTALLFGLTEPDREISVKPFHLFKRELTIRSSFINPFSHQRAISLLSNGLIKVKPIIAGEYPIEELAEILSNSQLRERGKILIKP